MKTDLYLGDCLEIMQTLGEVDAVITDPPYPDYYKDEYLYFDGILDPLIDLNCRQLVFWSAKVEFPLDYSAIHIWDKARGIGNQYERIFERNGKNLYKFFRGQKIHNSIDAVINKDVLTIHPSQKPIKLMSYLINEFTSENATILDPFMGSGTTGVACVQTGRNFIGIEIEPKYYEIAEKRIAEAQLQVRMPI